MLGHLKSIHADIFIKAKATGDGTITEEMVATVKTARPVEGGSRFFLKNISWVNFKNGTNLFTLQKSRRFSAKRI
jgi:hypothetical protein